MSTLSCFTTTGVFEAPENIQAECGLKQASDCDTDSFEIETASSDTHFDSLHEEDLEEMRSLPPSELEEKVC